MPASGQDVEEWQDAKEWVWGDEQLIFEIWTGDKPKMEYSRELPQTNRKGEE